MCSQTKHFVLKLNSKQLQHQNTSNHKQRERSNSSETLTASNYWSAEQSVANEFSINSKGVCKNAAEISRNKQQTACFCFQSPLRSLSFSVFLFLGFSSKCKFTFFMSLRTSIYNYEPRNQACRNKISQKISTATETQKLPLISRTAVTCSANNCSFDKQKQVTKRYLQALASRTSNGILQQK